MLTHGLILMVVGMGTVGIFLIVMVLIMQATGNWFVAHEHLFAPAGEPQRQPERSRPDESAAIAVAIAAVAAFRKR
jgi:Na+-transporting methylmalonyl-CoA/oxaloacetate decarboxylase gamma subunit